MSPWSISSSFEINFNLTTFFCLLMLVVNGHKKCISGFDASSFCRNSLMDLLSVQQFIYVECGDGSTISANKCEKPQKQSSNFSLPPQVKFVVMWIIKTVLLFFRDVDSHSSMYASFFMILLAYIFFAQQCRCFCSFTFSSPHPA